MTEREKMLCGKLYDPTDEELSELRKKARQAAIDYNNTNEDEVLIRAKILKEILGKYDESLVLEPFVRFDYGVNTYFGNGCFVNFNSVFLDCAEIHIGNNVFIGPNVSFYTPLHPLTAAQRKVRIRENGEAFDLEYAKPITVMDNVWLCGSVSVCGGVTIGENSVIGAGSVVTRDIPANVIAAGNPCKVIREINEDDIIDDEYEFCAY